MAQFVINQTIATADSEIAVTVDPQAPLPVGRQRFQLVVVDDSGIYHTIEYPKRAR